jgi:hypothetical protein
VADRHGIHPSLASLAVPLDTLTPDPRNARLHDDRNIEAVKKSYEVHGQRKPIVVQRRVITEQVDVPMDAFAPSGKRTQTKVEHIVRAGNGQLAAAQALGWSHIAAVIIEEDDRDAIAFAIRDNRTAELAEWDWQVISTEIAEFDTTDGEKFEDLGWSTTELLPLRQTEWFMEATGNLEDHQRKPKDELGTGDKVEVTVAGKDAAVFNQAMALMRERFKEPGMNPGHVIGRLAKHYLATIGHSKTETP